MISTYDIGVEPGLLESILRYKETHTGVEGTNIGGWHSRYFYDRVDVDWFNKPLDDILAVLDNKYKLANFWFNVNGKNHYNKWHAHSVKNDVAVYYVKSPEGAGDIEFMDKNGHVTAVKPRAGLVLVFPGDLKHRVCENTSDDIRVAAAMNLTKINQP